MKKTIIWIFGLGCILALFAISAYYLVVLKPSVIIPEDTIIIRIPTGSKIDDVIQILDEKKAISNVNWFAWLAEKMSFTAPKAGQYSLEKNWNNEQVIRHLRAGKQDEIKVIIPVTRDIHKIVSEAAEKLELDSVKLNELIHSKEHLQQIEFSDNEKYNYFLPDTYQFYWNTDEVKFLNRMKAEYDTFWKSKAEKRKNSELSENEIITVASIIEQETSKGDEMARIAGVYMNRIEKGMRLQADPTVKYAIGDWAIRRVLKKHLEFDSPYNTYKYAGLPPGPICIPSKQAIRAVLNAENHKYFYFCAKEDFSGYHNFAATLQDHLSNAKKYQRKLNEKKILK